MEANNIRIVIATPDGKYFFQPEDIVRLEASSNYTNIFFNNKKKMMTARVLKVYEQMLKPLGFLRTHRSHLVNKKYISFVDHDGTIYMRDESRVEMSRRKKQGIMKALMAA